MQTSEIQFAARTLSYPSSELVGLGSDRELQASQGQEGGKLEVSSVLVASQLVSGKNQRSMLSRMFVGVHFVDCSWAEAWCAVLLAGTGGEQN